MKIAPTLRGYYTVVVSSPTGSALNKDFHLSFGLYQNGNANCSNPTPALP